MSQTFRTITLNKKVLTVDGIYSAHSHHNPPPPKCKVDNQFSSPALRPRTTSTKKLSISTLHVGGGGRRKTTTFLCMNEQNKFRPRYYEHGCLWIQNVCNPTDILSRKHVSGVRASIQAHCQHQALVTGGVSVSFPTSNVTVPRSPIMGPGTQQSILIPISN